MVPEGPLQVRITRDGALRVTDARGVILLRTGLPGRPIQFWRDGGTAIEGRPSEGRPLPFPAESRIGRGLGHMAVGDRDFRRNLEGLLWVLCDDGRVLTVVHPSTARFCYLPLPGGRDPRIHFLPDRLEVRVSPAPGAEECWSVPWLALLPQILEVGKENPASRPSGTALLPFPRD
jgi:hypothetical protein